MAKVENSKVLKAVERKAFTHVGKEQVPNQLASQIVPVIIAEENVSNLIRSQSSASSGVSTIYTTPSTRKRTYLTGITLSYDKDGASDCTSIVADCVPFDDGATRSILDMRMLSLTASNQTITLSFPYPIKLQKGSAVRFSKTFTAGNMVSAATIMGFELEED